jgi:predicted flap endonuclease-1-like 5' DNA nuclease
MAMPIAKLRGVSYELEAKLKEQGIYSSDQLLQAARTPGGRGELAERIELDAQSVLELAKRADLARVRGIGGVFADLLEHVGVGTVGELATRRPSDLRAELVAKNEQERLAGRMPTLKVVEDWVLQATDLPEVLEL